MQKLRYSRQREVIYQCLSSVNTHPTADMLFQMLRPQHPNLSLGTVYRNLNQLAEQGLILRIPMDVDHFDAHMEPHAHLLCERCGCLQDIPVEPDPTQWDKLSQCEGCSIRREARMYYGVCSDCCASEQK